MYDFAKEMHFDIKGVGKKSTQDRTLIKLVKSPVLVVSASVVSKTIFLPSDPNELCDSLKLLQHERQVGINSSNFDEEMVAIVDNLLEKKCISKKQQKRILIKCNLLHK